ILRLAVAADRFGRGVSVGRFKPEGAREVRRAAVALSVLRDRLDRQVGQRTQMLAGVSHDLKTIVTRMKLQLAFMPAGPESQALQDDLAEMEETLGAYLAFARGEDQEEAQPVDVVELIEDVVLAARRGGAKVALRPLRARRRGAKVELRAGAARRALSNLLSNAARYGDRVEVGLEDGEDAVSILIDDDGPGIPPERRDEAFKPFARLDSGRNLQTGGHGLGLTIARDAARSCGGDLTLEDSPMGGLRARLRLPL
ncbi:MAG: ATP-binding protein, partial [Pseudomonadota bacterium]